jgi:hypothetical protein
MIGIFSHYSKVFLYVVGTATLLGFGLPLTIFPLKWARLFQWRLPEEIQLASFLGRSLGMLLTIIALFAILVPGLPMLMPYFYIFLLVILGAMLLLHVYGAIRRQQPATETWEIILWVLLFFLGLCFFPAV